MKQGASAKNLSPAQGQSGGSAREIGSVAGDDSPAAEQAFRLIGDGSSVPLGVPVRVKTGGEESIGIRNGILGWYNEDRTRVLSPAPEQWAPL